LEEIIYYHTYDIYTRQIITKISKFINYNINTD